MSKLFVLAKTTYGDFDMAYDEPLFVSSNIDILNQKKAELTVKLTPNELEYETHYSILPDKVKLL